MNGLNERPSAGASHQAGRPSRLRKALEVTLPPVVVLVVLVGGWYYVTYGVLTETRRFLLRPVHKVIEVGFLDGGNRTDALEALWSSTRVAFIGLVIAICIGFSLAILMSQAKFFERAIFPYVVVVQAMPILAIVPLIVFWFGTGQQARVIVCVIISLFPLVANTLHGLQSAEQGMHDLFTLHHASRSVRLRKLMFPAALPFIFTGLRISAGLSVIGAIVGDFFFARGDIGIGQLLRRHANQLNGEELLAAVILSSGLGVTVFLLFGVIRDRAVGRWHEATSGRS